MMMIDRHWNQGENKENTKEKKMPVYVCIYAKYQSKHHAKQMK